MLNPQRTIAELKELRELTADENGAWRVAWADTWLRAREWFNRKLQDLPVEQHYDAAGNNWVTLKGQSEKALLIGGHLDSVPGGGWLDGCLNVLAGLEVLRRIAAEFEGNPPVTVRLVDWADEEGARFGRSLLGSSAFSGTLQPELEKDRTDKDGVRLEEALQRCGVELDRMLEAQAEQKNAAAYIELHIEQGPVLLDMGLPLGAVLGTFGVERHAITFWGQAAHSGSTPMHRRKDAFLAAAKMAPEVYRIAERNGGVCTIGSCVTKPGIVTSVVEECTITLDQRHLDAAALARLKQEAWEASQRFAQEGGLPEPEWRTIWRIEPILFHPELIELCDQAIREVAGVSHRLPSGPLHDAAEVARAGIPTVMMFVQSLHGISHNKIEDTEEAHLELAVRAFDRLADKVMAWILR
ncbi:Zn-dependent hydrolase [Meiothermus sp. QL-1]|uniref:Zn-dependent hydrolase n=1 Tax=Meiothermus sp. QL-1 TaxID=2058095 RepID=UPI000E0ABCDE|nr:Zn-dependent hydrolase [Meiothermus sp. QL-1]RDI95769.1 Zn-dependent hydrolase [Meiothermus sp. QL-1]